MPAQMLNTPLYSYDYRPSLTNLDIYKAALDNIQDRNDKAIEYRDQITAAINALDLNDAENQWKADYANEVLNQIYANVNEYGSYSSALQTAKTLATTAATDPRVMGRVLSSKNYREAEEEVRKRAIEGKIDRDAYDAWKILNPYSYTDGVDPNDPNRVIQGDAWQARWTPLDSINLYSELRGFFETLPHEKGDARANLTDTYINADGTQSNELITNEYNRAGENGGRHNTQINNRNKYERVTRTRFVTAAREYLTNNPRIAAYINQLRTIGEALYSDSVSKINNILASNNCSDIESFFTNPNISSRIKEEMNSLISTRDRSRTQADKWTTDRNGFRTDNPVDLIISNYEYITGEALPFNWSISEYDYGITNNRHPQNSGSGNGGGGGGTSVDIPVDFTGIGDPAVNVDGYTLGITHPLGFYYSRLLDTNRVNQDRDILTRTDEENERNRRSESMLIINPTTTPTIPTTTQQE